MAEYKVVDAEKLDAELKSLANKIREKSGTTETLDFYEGDFTNAVNAIESGGGLPDWDDDSPIVASGAGRYSDNNMRWEITEKGTMRWKVLPDVENNNNFNASLTSSSAIAYWWKDQPNLMPFISKIKQIYLPDGVTTTSSTNWLVSCERIRIPESFTNAISFQGWGVKSLDLSSSIFATLPNYHCNAAYYLEKVTLCSLTNIVSSYCFASCYSLKDINLENITEFKAQSFTNTYALRKPIVFNRMLTNIGTSAFMNSGITSVTFQNSLDNLPTIDNNAFLNCVLLTDIYCPWAEGAVANAPWGATNATIHYNSEV